MFVIGKPISNPRNPYEQRLSILRELIRENHNFYLAFDDEDLEFRHGLLRRGMDKFWISVGVLGLCFGQYSFLDRNRKLTLQQKSIFWGLAVTGVMLYMAHSISRIKLDGLDYVANKYVRDKEEKAPSPSRL